jgi:2-methylisocitrate lyase-like PEP mutase family enzyme
MAPKDGPKLLREALKTGKFILPSSELLTTNPFPGNCLNGCEVFDGISAKHATIVGFDFLYLTGSGTTAGTCDTDFAAKRCEMVVRNTHLPVIADADTGFGTSMDITWTIQLYEEAGMAGCHVGDQVFPGQVQGTNVVDGEAYLERIRSAVEARSNPDFAIIARTHVQQPDTCRGEEAGERAFTERVRRLKGACIAGAKIAFVESTRTEEACYKSLVERLAPFPVMINVVPHVSWFGVLVYGLG